MSVAKASGTMKVTNLSSNVAALVCISAQRKDCDHAWNCSVSVLDRRTLYRCRYGYEKRKPDHTAYYSYSPCIAFYKDHIRNIKKKNIKNP